MADPTETRITLRLPTALRDRLLVSAERNERSMNGEIVYRLDEFDQLSAALKHMADQLGHHEEAVRLGLPFRRALDQTEEEEADPVSSKMMFDILNRLAVLEERLERKDK